MPSKQTKIEAMDELRKDAASALVEAEEIVTKAEEEGRELYDEEQAEIDRLVEHASNQERIYAEEQRETVICANKQAIGDIRQRFNARPSPQESLTKGAPARVTRVRELWVDDPKKGYKTHQDFLMDVMKASMGARESVQLSYLKIKSAAGSDEHGTYSDPYGGYLVPIGFSPTMLRVDPEDDPTMGKTTPVPMDVPLLNIPARVDKNHTSSVSGGLRVYRRAEADTVTASRIQTELITMRANPLMGISYATEELMTDSPISFVALLQAGFNDEFNSKVLDERLNGTGVGEYLGVLKSPALITVSRQASNEIQYLDILNMMARSWGYKNAIWLANHDTIPQLGQMNLQVGAGGSAIFVQSAAESLPSTLMGKPLFFTEYMQMIGAVGDIGCFNWTQYLEGTYQPLKSAESIHVRFANNERAFRFTMRNEGQPWWRSAMTPKNSTNTLSPFVTLSA